MTDLIDLCSALLSLCRHWSLSSSFCGHEDISSRLNNYRQQFSWAEFYVDACRDTAYCHHKKETTLDVHVTLNISGNILRRTLEHNIWQHLQSVKLTNTMCNKNRKCFLNVNKLPYLLAYFMPVTIFEQARALRVVTPTKEEDFVCSILCIMVNC